MAKQALLLLDDDSLLKVLRKGTFKLQSIGFEEAHAIIDMHTDEDDIFRCFGDSSLQKIVHEYLNVPKRDFPYKEVTQMDVEQDAIIFRLHSTDSATRPIIKMEDGTEAKKTQNVYVYCELISRLA